jgi:hypothetical protein
LKSNRLDDKPEIRLSMILPEFDHVAALRVPEPNRQNRCRPGLVAIESRCNSTSMRHKITLAG